jgi:hypothetical protein
VVEAEIVEAGFAREIVEKVAHARIPAARPGPRQIVTI